MAGDSVKIMARNQKAHHEYFIEEKFEAGIELSGTEVKSIRAGTLSLKEAWCQIKDGELYIRQMHIAPYEQGNIFNKDPLRPRRLLVLPECQAVRAATFVRPSSGSVAKNDASANRPRQGHREIQPQPDVCGH